MVMHGGEETSVDPETGLPNRFGWEALLEAEEQRARRYGGRHGLFLVRLGPDAPPVSDVDPVEAAAAALTRALRETDFLARVDGHTFGVLALYCDDPEVVTDRIRIALGPAPPLARIEARTAGPDLCRVWGEMAATPAGPARPAPPVGHADFVPRPPICLN